MEKKTKKSVLLLLFLLLYSAVQGQTVNSFDGFYLRPRGTYRLLTFFINIHYDQTPDKDPIQKSGNVWQPGMVNSVNTSRPNYVERFLSADSAGIEQAVMTRLYFESSLGNLLLLGDFMTIDVAQSFVNESKTTTTFDWSDVVKKALRLVNNEGGLQTFFNHDSIQHYDTNNDRRFDFVQFLIRNTRGDGYGNLVQGNGQMGFASTDFSIQASDTLYQVGLYSVQCIEQGDITTSPKNIIFHEFSHALFGSNAAHTSGGHHFRATQTATFLGTEGGYGLMGGYGSSLVSCNGYERWRMQWLSKQYNPFLFPIAASGKYSDVVKSDSVQQFVLRDFVTTGDAVRIQLPYTDSGAHKQYLWLENHQIGNNNKLDYLQYSDTYTCREKGNSGVYAYVQVGKDILTGTNKQVHPPDEADNLRQLSAKGNWDWQKMTDTTVKCVKWPPQYNRLLRVAPNALSGVSELSTIYLSSDSELQKRDGLKPEISIYADGVTSGNLPSLGDNGDAFTGKCNINISSNPTPFGVVTCYSSYSDYWGLQEKRIQAQNNKSIHLSGLGIDIDSDNKNGTILITVRWNDYELTNDVRWTGDIVLHEKLIVKRGVTLLLDQSTTATQTTRDVVSGEFAPITRLRCLSGSTMIVEKGATLIIDNNSVLDINTNANFIVEKGGKIIQRNGGAINQ